MMRNRISVVANSSLSLDNNNNNKTMDNKHSTTAPPVPRTLNGTTSTAVILKENMDSKVGLAFCQRGRYTYISKVHDHSLAALTATSLVVPGMRVISVNHVPIESSTQAALLVRTAMDQVVLVTEGMAILAMKYKHPKKSKNGGGGRMLLNKKSKKNPFLAAATSGTMAAKTTAYVGCGLSLKAIPKTGEVLIVNVQDNNNTDSFSMASSSSSSSIMFVDPTTTTFHQDNHVNNNNNNDDDNNNNSITNQVTIPVGRSILLAVNGTIVENIIQATKLLRDYTPKNHKQTLSLVIKTIPPTNNTTAATSTTSLNSPTKPSSSSSSSCAISKTVTPTDSTRSSTSSSTMVDTTNESVSATTLTATSSSASSSSSSSSESSVTSSTASPGILGNVGVLEDYDGVDDDDDDDDYNSCAVKSYSIASEMDLMEKVESQMKDLDEDLSDTEEEDSDDDSSVISEMTAEQAPSPSSNNSNSNTNMNNKHSKKNRTKKHDRHSFNSNNHEAAAAATEEERAIVVTVKRPSTTNATLIGISAKKDNKTGQITITGVARDGWFGRHAADLVGSTIRTINGQPCPDTISSLIEMMKQPASNSSSTVVLECVLPKLSSPPTTLVQQNQRGAAARRGSIGSIRRGSMGSTSMTGGIGSIQLHNNNNLHHHQRSDSLLTSAFYEPSSFSCLDTHQMEEFLPHYNPGNHTTSKPCPVTGEETPFSYQPQLDETSVVIATVEKPDGVSKAGIRLRKSQPIDSILITGIAEDGLFGKTASNNNNNTAFEDDWNTALRVGQKIVSINNMPCPSTTNETVQMIKQITGTLRIEAIDIDWDATLSDAWAAEAAASPKTKTNKKKKGSASTSRRSK